MKTNTPRPDTSLTRCWFRAGLACHKLNTELCSPLSLMRTGLARSLMFGLALGGLLLCGNARANIALQDGSVAVTTSTSSTSVSINNFTVTAGASVLVVSLVDRNSSSGNSGPASLTWNGGAAQTLTRIVSVNGAGSTYAWANIYYLFNPTPGTATITATDTSGNTPSVMAIQAYALSGVDTNVAPVPYIGNGNPVNSVIITLGSGTPMLGWAAVCSHYGTSTSAYQLSATGGGLNYTRTTVTITEAMGYVANLSPGSSTVTGRDTSGGTQKLAVGVAVFAPYLPGPAAPTLTAVTGETNKVDLSWTDNSGGAATDYVVWRNAGSGSFSPIQTNNGNGSTTFTDTNVSPYATYNYSVQALGAAGAGQFSDVASATPVGVPLTPTGVAVAGVGNSAVLTWTAATGAATYNILRSTTSGTETLLISGVTGTTYTDSPLTLLTRYYYKVQAVNDIGTNALDSAEVSVIPLSAPGSLVATAQTNQVALSWADTTSGLASGYNVQRSLASGSGYQTFATLNGSGSTSFTDHTARDGTTYYYVVQAVSSNATSAASSEQSATPFFALPPGLPTTIVKPDGGTNAITIVTNGAGSTISSAFTVSSGAHALVVELWDKNTFNNGSSPQSMTWVVGTTTNILTRAVSRSSAGTTYSDCNIYYVYNPKAGAGTISATDTNGTSEGMTMMAYTLRGVDTTVAPVVYSQANASATTLSITTASVTPSNAWAAVLSYSGNGGSAITQTSTTGTSIYKNVNNNDQQCLGYVSDLRAGSSTITMTGAGGATKCTLVVAVFMPAVPTPIAVLDGSLYPVAKTGSGVKTISWPFGVSQGASALVVAFLDYNNGGTPIGVVWSNATFGVTQTLSISSGEQWCGYGQAYPYIYSIMNPLPGTGSIIGTDNATASPSFMVMQVYTLVGVDTALAAAGYGVGTESTLPAGVRTNFASVNASSSTLVGSWAAVNCAEGNSGTTWHIDWTSTSGVVVTTNIWAGANNSPTTMGYISNLNAGASTFSATAYNGASLGGNSTYGINAVVFAPLVLVPAVSAPTNIVATAGTNQVALTWADSSGGLAANFIVLRSITSGSGYVQLAVVSGSTSNYVDTAVYDGTMYYYVVQAQNNAGTSPNSAQASAQPFFALPAGLSGNVVKTDGGTGAITTVANGGGSTISSSFTVSQGASVLVVELWDQNTFNNHSSPATLDWVNDLSGATQTLIRAISQVSGGSPYSDCNIYYLYNPTPGSGIISGTDTNAVTIGGLTMMPFTLKGVNTTVAPVTYGANSASATTLSITTSAHTAPGAWAAVMSYDANGQPITQGSTSGTSTYQSVNNNAEQALGYVGGLAYGSSTISMTSAGGAANCALAVAVFMPAIGTGIALQDGSIFSTSTVGAGVATITQPFTVTAGASVLVAAVYDNNNNTGVPGPNLVWSNSTFGVVQPMSVGVATNATAYGWTWAILYYLMSPLPGPGVVIGTDPGGTHNTMFMQVYSLSGVDTTVTPVGLSAADGSASVLSVNTPPETVSFSWAPVMSVNYNGGGGNTVTITATSGGVTANRFLPDNLQCTMGYVSNLGAGTSTITATGTGTATHMDMAAEVFTPLVTMPAPTSLVATGQTNQVKLAWTDGSGGLATSYVLLRSTTSGVGYTAIRTNIGNGSTTYTDTSVIDWIPYYYVVQAYGPSGVSIYSPEATAYAVGLPTAVTALTAFGDINQVDLSWNNELGAEGYVVSRSLTGSGFAPIGTSGTNSYTDTAVVDGTRYYYEVYATNSFGAGPSSAPASAIPVVTFFTNWFGVFNTDTDSNGWFAINANPNFYVYPDPPPSGPSSQCLVLDSIFGPGTTADFQGIGKGFTPTLNVRTYPRMEMDIKNLGVWDDNSQIQAIQLNLEVPVGGNPTYVRGTWGDIVLRSSESGGSWTHYTVPLSNWAAYDLTQVTALGINIFDAQCVTVAKNLVVGFANIEFSGAPAWAPVISVANRAAATGSTSVILTGRVSGLVDSTNLALFVNTPVSVTINGSTQTTGINDAAGDFSIAFNTTGFANGTYPVVYTSASDMVGLIGATNSSTTLTLAAAPPRPTILPPSVDATGTNLVVKVATQSGWGYYLLSTPSLTPPVVWSTSSFTVGTGGTITNLVPIESNPPELFLKYVIE